MSIRRSIGVRATKREDEMKERIEILEKSRHVLAGLALAALFAVHPLNIESVIWIVERENLLSTLFGLLTILAYVRHAQNPGWKRYSMIWVCFILELMAKPMLVTLLFVLLLLDYWPL